MTQFKSRSRTKVKRSHSCAQLKTDHFSGSKKYKTQPNLEPKKIADSLAEYVKNHNDLF